MNKRKKLRTYDEIVVDTLRQIEPATIKQLARVLNYNSTQSLWYLLKRLCREELIYINIKKKPYKYAVKEVKVSYENNNV